MSEDELKELLKEGIVLIKEGRVVEAVFFFEEMLHSYGRSASILSLLGLSMAKAKGDFHLAEKLCLEAINKSFYRADLYRNLAEVYLLRNKKAQAISTLRSGLKVNRRNKSLINELVKLGPRTKPPIPFLSRSNPLNKYIGIAKSKFA